MSTTLLERAASLLRPVPDFPKEGILFFDLNPLLRDHEVMDHVAATIADYWRPLEVDVVAGFDARGFLFCNMVAQRLGVAATMIRKKGKLPPPTKSVSYDLEYGSAEIEMADDGFLEGKRVLLMDDLLATGGTAEAGVRLVELLGGPAVGFACVTELPELCGRSKLLSIPVQSLITIMDDKALVDVEYCVDVLARRERDGALLLINRLQEVPGVALPGGRVEARESMLSAAARELMEETGVTLGQAEHCSTLTGITRDPRGPKVSVVIAGLGGNEPLRDEPDKTHPFWAVRPDELPSYDQFVLGHGSLVHVHDKK